MCRKHCDCTTITPDCCKDGWKITLAGSRFLKPAETRYAPVEGEALAIAYALKQTKFFTLGCDGLLVVTDHEPLTKVLGDRTLDEISNTRLLKLKQRTLPWRFSIKHLPGKSNHFANATSRSPVNNPEDKDDDDDRVRIPSQENRPTSTSSTILEPPSQSLDPGWCDYDGQSCCHPSKSTTRNSPVPSRSPSRYHRHEREGQSHNLLARHHK